MRGSNLIRIQHALQVFCRRGGVTVQDACEELEVDRRTLYRMKDTLEAMGIPIESDRFDGEGNRVRFFVGEEVRKEAARLPNVHVTQDEVVALNALRGNDSFYRGTRLERHIETLMDKVGALATAQCRKKSERIRKLFIPVSKFTKNYSGTEEIFRTLVDSVLDSTSCTIVYANLSRGKVSEFEIEPLHFFEREGGLYLLYHSPKHDTVRILAVERIRSIRKEKRRFSPPPGFDPHSYIGALFNFTSDESGRPMRFRARFSARQAPFIRERRWAPNQEIVEEEGGTIVLSFETMGRYDITRWVLGQGAEVEVLEPEDLRAEVARIHGEAAARYR